MMRAQIEDNMVLGIGTGSTIELLIPKLAERIHKETKYHWRVLLIKVHLLQKLDINVVDINDVGR